MTWEWFRDRVLLPLVVGLAGALLGIWWQGRETRLIVTWMHGVDIGAMRQAADSAP